MNFRAFRQQPFASTLTPPREGGASAFGAHARAKSVLVFPGPFRALECPFHGFVCRRGATLGTFLFLSTVQLQSALVIVLVLLLVLDLVRLRARARARVRVRVRVRVEHIRIANTFTLWNNETPHERSRYRAGGF